MDYDIDTGYVTCKCGESWKIDSSVYLKIKFINKIVSNIDDYVRIGLAIFGISFVLTVIGVLIMLSNYVHK
jgi:hypothetical protein